MIELDVPKDLKDFEPKFLFGLTLRQFIAAGVGFGSAAIVYSVVAHFIPEGGIKVITGLCCVAIAFLFGWVRPYNVPFERFIIMYLFTVVLPPKKRLYKIENKYEVLEKEIKKEEAEKAKAEKKKKPQNDKENKKNKKKGGTGK